MGKRNKKKKHRSRSQRGEANYAESEKNMASDGRLNSPDISQNKTEVQLQPFGQGPRFSVLMAAYNRAELIHVAIDSVLAQDFKEYELVIVDDGSTDHTPSVVTGYSDPRIRYIRKDRNEGRSPTRNRAISEARGEFVLWMADDDLLEPGLLSLYDSILSSEPQIDVVYGKLQLFDHESGQDLNVFTPNDWTGRDQEVIGAKLYGSCVPDGGSAVRRTLYGQVGAGPYDDEFVRAQDYELWTRIVGQAKFRFVDQVVYRYRKHDGGTSWGEFIDLTLDSKIIRRHLNRHPLKTLFPRLNWKRPERAQSEAFLRIAKNLQMYGDHENVLRFVEAIPGYDTWPEAIDYRVRAYLAMGDLSMGRQIIESSEGKLGYSDPTVNSLKEILARLTRFCEEAPPAIEVGHVDAVIQDAVSFDATYFQTYDTMKRRAQSHENKGQTEAALHCYCLAARLNLNDSECAEATERLRTLLGPTPKTDLTAMRRRLRERIFELPTHSDEPMAHNTLVSVIASDMSADDLNASVSSLLNQTHTHFEVLSHQEFGPAGDSRFRVFDPGSDLLAAAQGGYIAWLEPDVVWTAPFLERALKSLSSGAPAVACLGQRMVTSQDAMGGVERLDDRSLSLASLMAQPKLSLGHLVHRRPEGDDPQLGQAVHARWLYLMKWLSADQLRLDPSISLTRRCDPALELNTHGDQETSVKDLMDVYGCFSQETSFDIAARDAQNTHLNPIGYHQARRGRSTILLCGGTDFQHCRSTIERLRQITWAAHEFVLVLDQFRREDIEPLSTWLESQSDVRVYRPGANATAAKVVNDALTRAHGEFIVFAQVGLQLSAGWLGRLQYYLHKNPSWGMVSPKHGMPTASSPDEGREPSALTTADARCTVLHRRTVDTIGGMDVTLGAEGYHWTDYSIRMRIAGLSLYEVSNVWVDQLREEPERTSEARARFTARWGSSNPDVAGVSFQKEDHCHPFGAETGFRPDGRSVVIEEALERNILIIPPWTDRSAMQALMSDVRGVSKDVSFWLRAPVGEGGGYSAQLRNHWNDCEFNKDEQPNFLIIDAHLAPEREAGLYLAASALYVDEDWVESRTAIRRASDCGRRVLRGPTELHRWIEAKS